MRRWCEIVIELWQEYPIILFFFVKLWCGNSRFVMSKTIRHDLLCQFWFLLNCDVDYAHDLCMMHRRDLMIQSKSCFTFYRIYINILLSKIFFFCLFVAWWFCSSYSTDREPLVTGIRTISIVFGQQIEPQVSDSKADSRHC